MRIIQWILHLGHKGKHDIGKHKRSKKKAIYTDIINEQQTGNYEIETSVK